MSHTNSTTNYGLPQFVTTDKPFWLTDVNQAYSDIDLAMKNNADAATTAGNNAIQALSDASAAATTASGADAKASGAIASIADIFDSTSTYATGAVVIYNNLLYRCTNAVTVPGPWTGTANWDRTTVEDIADSKQNIHDTSLNTTSKNIVGAINEVNNGLGALGGYTIDTFTLENNSYINLPTYDEAQIVFISRGSGGLYMAHWSGVTTIVSASGHTVEYFSGPNRVKITNNSGVTDRITVIYK